MHGLGGPEARSDLERGTSLRPPPAAPTARGLDPQELG